MNVSVIDERYQYVFQVEPAWTLSQPATVLCLSMAVVSCLGGLLGNLLLTAAILRTPSLRRTNTNRLVLHLCLAGAVVSGTNVPLVISILVASVVRQSLPPALLSLQTLTFTAGVTCQLGLLSAISYERFHCVTYPFRTTDRQARRLKIELGVVWLVALVCSLIDVRLTPDSALTVLGRAGQLPHNFANSFCLLHFPVGAINIVIIDAIKYPRVCH
ncbi:D(1B) dopamine receptor-like [Amphibalanus amphitrite]|uniref:D(1B) dopamine receptor-like n=1 Tax=Amphibalanus amphitrite TaxID=1232801 RepID=UPI001C917DCE|nr:D(1B) dopamine receptor-like [Amphibalanus amphitrite]